MTKRLGLHADSESAFLRIDSMRSGVVLPIALSITFFYSLFGLSDELRFLKFPKIIALNR
jgi:hypothetical protein